MLVTILLTRIILFFMWDSTVMKPQIEDNWHHMYTGILLVMATLPFSTHVVKIVRAVGIGLFIDEWMHVFHVIFQIKTMDYWSGDFLLVTLIGIILVGRYYYKIEVK